MSFIHKYLIVSTIVAIAWFPPPPVEAGILKFLTNKIGIPISRLYRFVRNRISAFYKSESFSVSGYIAQALFLHDRVSPVTNDKSKSSEEKLCEFEEEKELLGLRCKLVLTNEYFRRKLHWFYNEEESSTCIDANIHSSAHGTIYKSFKVLRCPVHGVNMTGKNGKQSSKVGDTHYVYISSSLNEYKNRTIYYVLLKASSKNTAENNKNPKKTTDKDGSSEEHGEGENQQLELLKVETMISKIDKDEDTKNDSSKKKKKPEADK